MSITRRSLLLRAPLAAGILAAGLPSIARSQAAPVKIRYLASRGGLSPHELADELGYFKGLGIELENVGYVGGGPESLFALASGSVDLGSAATPAVINSIAGGNDFVAAYPSNGINKDVKSVFYVLEDSPIKSIADIAGKTISVNTLGAHLDYTVREALHSVGLPPDAAKLVVVPGP
ncbi:MAG: ABC transporter substrate-binding protein, partial [Mesorhizobium sp.]|nr:ABC transporter substrate-binding protein [Mesorhizobium sp.]